MSSEYKDINKLNLKVIICDDIIKEQTIIHKHLKEFALNNNIDFQIVELINNNIDLIEYLEENRHEPFIIFMDILLDNVNSINLINENLSLFSSSEIIFITSSKAFRKKIYNVSHSFYLEKTEIETYFNEAMDLAIKNLQKSAREFLIFSINNKYYKFKFSEIISIERNNRIIKIIGHNINESIYCKIDYIEQFLDKRFIRCHNSIIVNFDKIHKFEKDYFLMEDGRQLSISRGRKKEVMDKISNLVINNV